MGLLLVRTDLTQSNAAIIGGSTGRSPSHQVGQPDV